MGFIAKLNWFFRERWKSYALSIVLIMADFTLGMVPPIIIGRFVDQVGSGQLTWGELHVLVWILVALAIVVYLISVLWVNTLFRNSIRVERELRTRLLSHLLKMTPTFFQRNRRGDLMAQATNDIRAVNEASGYGIMTIVHTVVGGTLTLTMLFWVGGWKLTLLTLLPMPLISVAMKKLGAMMHKRFHAAQEAFGALNDRTLESISGVRVIRAYGQEQPDFDAFERVAEDARRKNVEVAVVYSLFQPVITFVVGLCFTVGIGFGAWLVIQGELTLGNLISFNMYLGFLIWPMIAFGEFINVWQRGNASIDRIQATLVQEPDVKEEPHVRYDVQPGTIEWRNLTFRYPGADHDSLQEITLRLEAGQTLGIVGKTGSGKSTLLKTLLKQYPIDAGRVWIGGVPIEEIASERLRSWIGYVPQEHLLLSRTIRENICLGAPDAHEEQIRHVVRLASLEQDLAQMPDGLDTLIGENGLMLSGGQKQRIGIARALIIDPEILILDDALSAVDARTEKAILTHIRAERLGKMTLIVTHRLSAVQHADHILVLEDGKIMEEGTHEQLMQKGGWYKEQYEYQQMEETLEA